MNLLRTLANINYRIHTGAIKDKIIPDVVTKEQANAALHLTLCQGVAKTDAGRREYL